MGSLPEPPPEDEDAHGYYESVNIPAHKESPKPAYISQPRDSAQPVNEIRVWGKVIRKLRADKCIMLWIACQDAEPKAVGDKLVVSVNGDNEYNLLTKPESAATLQSIISAECDLKLEIKKKGASHDDFEDDVNAIKNTLGDVEIVD